MVRGHLTRRGLTLAAGASLILPTAARARNRPPVIRTRHGPVSQGVSEDGRVGFSLGIPYGADTGPRRFQPPVPPAPWTTPLHGHEYGPACPQRGDEPNQSEDCLRLNVWTPRPMSGARRPVLVYIHGGAYATGSGSSPLTDGTRLAAAQDVVVVTVNHRLGPLGYAYLARLAPGFEDSGNLGQLDLILALK